MPMDQCKACSCVVDRHRFDADPDPDSTFHFVADPDPDSNPNQSFTRVRKFDFFL
jgi:hypothetical protein